VRGERGRTSGSHDPMISVLSTSNSLDCPDPLLDTIRPFRRTLAPASNLLLAHFLFLLVSSSSPFSRGKKSKDHDQDEEEGEEIGLTYPATLA
jgi:hypothetical protein